MGAGYGLILIIGLFPILGILILPAFISDMEIEDRHVIAHIQHFEKWQKIYIFNPFCWLGYAVVYQISKRMVRKIKHTLGGDMFLFQN